MTKKKRKLNYEQEIAMMIAMTVRNNMEDFHCEHLLDDQMKELNPIIRNAIYTTLHALKNYAKSDGARAFCNFQKQLIPDYWEAPKLMKDYTHTVKRYKRDKNQESRL